MLWHRTPYFPFLKDYGTWTPSKAQELYGLQNIFHSLLQLLRTMERYTLSLSLVCDVGNHVQQTHTQTATPIKDPPAFLLIVKTFCFLRHFQKQNNALNNRDASKVFFNLPVKSFSQKNSQVYCLTTEGKKQPQRSWESVWLDQSLS